MSTHVDFWKEWNQLAYLKEQYFRGENIVCCNKCHKTSQFNIYSLHFQGIEIKQVKDSVRKVPINRKRKININDEIMNNEGVKRNLQCQICLNLIDLDINLQWDSCAKTYWYDCLMDWMLKNSTCPNWRIVLTKTTIHPSREWKKFIEILNEVKVKTNDPLWDEHKENWSLFWTNWSLWVWSKWVISKIHNDHNLVEVAEVSEKLHNRSKDELKKK